jgi:hypothetical protein
MRKPVVATVLLASAIAAGGDVPPASGGKHPHFDSKGVLEWFEEPDLARESARWHNRVILIVYARRT